MEKTCRLQASLDGGVGKFQRLDGGVEVDESGLSGVVESEEQREAGVMTNI